jgi:phosphoglycolate phosphatase-like HAD superfamily hydrolase
MIRVIALDFDGVILESNEAKTAAFGELMSAHGPEASEAMARYHMENRGVSRYVKFEWFYRTHLGRGPTPDETAALNDRFNDLSLEAVVRADFVPGAEAFLEEYAGRLPLYVVSGTPEAELKRIVAARNLDRYFVDVLGTPKGKAQHLADILAREMAAPDEALMVGDADTDLNAALACGVRFFGRGNFPGRCCSPDLTGLGEFLSGHERTSHA